MPEGGPDNRVALAQLPCVLSGARLRVRLLIPNVQKARPPTPTSRRRVYVVELKPGVQGFRLVSTRWETTRFGKQVRYATDDSENNLKTCLFPEDCTLKIWWKKKGQEELELLKSDKEWPEELWQGGTLVLEPKPKKAT